MPYEVTRSTLDGVLILRPQVHEDARGSLYESFNVRDFKAATGLDRTFVQDNHTLSKKDVLRGLHFQVHHPQGKLIRVLRGAVFDVAVDIRPMSLNFRHWFGIELSAENRRQLWIPEGFAHGFLTLSDEAEVLYKVTDYRFPEYERSLSWRDSAIGIEWPMAGRVPVLAPKDAHAPVLQDAVFL